MIFCIIIWTGFSQNYAPAKLFSNTLTDSNLKIPYQKFFSLLKFLSDLEWLEIFNDATRSGRNIAHTASKLSGIPVSNVISVIAEQQSVLVWKITRLNVDKARNGTWIPLVWEQKSPSSNRMTAASYSGTTRVASGDDGCCTLPFPYLFHVPASHCCWGNLLRHWNCCAVLLSPALPHLQSATI